MGANQSSTGGAAAAQTAEVKTSYYELLNIDRQSSEEEIKKAYRRRALELHPDRNFGDVERATKLFTEVQAAYEVLSDPQERAWYDSHEQIILKGQDAEEANYEHEMGITSADEVTALMRKFNRNIDFSDSPSGFYGFLRDMFEKLAKEESAAAYHQNLDERDYPTFGHQEDEFEDVVKEFYAGWSNFSTVKSFSWKHKYRKTDVDDRWTRRAVDKENTRFAEQGKKEFNEAVRQLVAFVRKRDPRYAPPSDAERTEAMRLASKAQAAKQKAAYEAKVNQEVPDWITRRDSDEIEEEEEEVEEDHYECMACHKTFKSEKQFDAHEKSKKHQKAVAALKKQMRKENAHLGLAEDGFANGEVAMPALAATDSEEYLTNEKVEADDDAIDSLANDEDILHKPMESLIISEDEDDDNSEVLTNGQPRDVGAPNSGVLEIKSEDGHDNGESTEHKRDSDSSAEPVPAVPNASDEFDHEGPVEAQQPPKLGKAAQKRAKRAAQEAVAAQDELRFRCATCNSGFPSKTRLFQHIKDFDHAAPPSATSGKKSKAGKGKKR